MVGIGQLQALAMARAKKLAPGQSVTALTYKKDRGFTIKCLADGIFLFTEFGYASTSRETGLAGLKKAVRAAIKREFPRSNKAWLQKGEPDNAH